MELKCARCGYSTDRISNLKHHLLRKKTCEDVLSCKKIPSELLSDMEKDKAGFNHSCQHCGLAFKTRQGIRKHSFKCNHVNKELERLTEEYIRMKHELDVLKASNNKTINVTNNVTNNFTNNITIVLNNFGQEDTSYVEKDKEFLDQCMKDLLTNAVRSVIEKIYFDVEHPENHTIKMKNFKTNQVVVHDDGIWQNKHTSETIPKMLHRGKRILHNHYLESGEDKKRIEQPDEHGDAVMKFNYLNNISLSNTLDYKSAVSKIKNVISNYKFKK